MDPHWYKYTCRSPPHCNTFTLLKRVTETANLSPHLRRNGDMASRVAALLLLGVICVHFAAGEIVVDCCLKKAVKPLPIQIIDGYIIQDGGNGCQLSATAFITKAGRILCVSHPSEQDWVKKHIQVLDKRRQRQ